MTSGSKFLLVRKHFALAKVERHSCPQSSFTCLCAHSPQPGAHHPATTKKVCHCKFHSIIISSSMLNLRRLARRKTKSLLPTNGCFSLITSLILNRKSAFISVLTKLTNSRRRKNVVMVYNMKSDPRLNWHFESSSRYSGFLVVY